MKTRLKKIFILLILIYGQIVLIDAYTSQKDVNPLLDTIFGAIIVLWAMGIVIFFNLYLRKKRF